LKLADTCLQLDVGNSSAKWRLLTHGRVTATGKYMAGDEASRRLLLECAAQVEQIWISSVAAPAAETELAAVLRDHWVVEPWFARSQARTGSLINSYQDPARMGVDRWLVMLAATKRASGRVCVVDAGSALTIDIVAASGQHEGGYIIPGPALMERALLLDTDRVRFEEDVGYDLTPGSSTAEAVRHGIALAQAGAVALAVDGCGSEPMALLFCGGGGEHLQRLVGRGGIYAADLVFEGLEVMAALES
jgi:type III pantothenate kinase